MTIHDQERFLASLPDWAMLDGCFGTTRIAPTDVDGLVERNGRCLFLEHKLPGATLKTGQLRTFHALAKQGNTVLVFWGEGSQVQRILKITRESLGAVVSADLADLRAEVAEWFVSANLASPSVAELFNLNGATQ